jgi:putative ABC transport system permease protein
MSRMLSDLRFGLRFLQHNLGFAVVAVAIMALGIALSTTLLAIVKGALLDPWPYRGYDRIVTFAGNYPEQGRTGFSLWSAPEVEDLRRASDLFEFVIAGDAHNVTVSREGHPARVAAALITPNAFAMLGVGAAIGRTLEPRDASAGAPPVVVVSDHFWRTVLGADPAVVGQTALRIDEADHVIVGVMPAPFVFWDSEIWMPLRLDAAAPRRDRNVYVQAQLRSGVTPEAAEGRLRAVARQWQADHPEMTDYAGLTFSIRPLVDSVLRDLRPTMYLLLVAVGLVLFVATANLANAMLAKGLAREGEIALRRALGASAGQMMRQLLTESVLIGVAGALAGSAGAVALLPRVLALIPFGYVPAEAHVALDSTVLAATAGTAVCCGVLLGLVPALRAARVDPGTLLKQADARTGSRRSHRCRALFSVTQLALAVGVVGLAVAAFGSVRAAVGRSPGFETDDLWTARLAPSATASAEARALTYDHVLRQIREARGVRDAVLASDLPVATLPRTLVSLGLARERGATLDVDIVSVSPGFFRLLRIPVVAGRAFAEADRLGARPVGIVTHALAARLWPHEDGLEARLVVGEGPSPQALTIVGVVGDVTPTAADVAMRPVLFVPLAQRPPVTAAVAVESDAPAGLLPVVSRAAAVVDPLLPVFGVQMLEQARRDTLGPQLLAAALLGLFGLAVLILSAVGVYAVMSHSVEERGRELGIRLALGARPVQLFGAEVRRAAVLVGTSVLGGAGMTAVAVRGLAASSTIFRTDVAAPILVAACVVTLLALTGTIVPALRASRASVAGALRGR